MASEKGQIWNPTDYNRVNAVPLRDGKELIQRILADHPQKVETIVDLGCGSGNVTAELASTVPHKKLVACDIDPDMVEFAKKHYGKSAEYVVQDIAVPIDQMQKSLKGLQGHACIVFSNFVFQILRVEDRKAAVDNVCHLLKPGGRCYINLVAMPCSHEKGIPQEEISRLNELYGLPEQEDDIAIWTKLLGESGLENVDLQVHRKQCSFEAGEDFKVFFSSVRNLLKMRLKVQMSEEEANAETEKHCDLLMRIVQTPHGETLIPQLPENPKDVHYTQICISATKAV